MTEQNKSIFNEPNKYGYKININHTKIRPLYVRYLKWKGLRPNTPLSDEQRFEFEKYILEMINK